MKVIGHQKWFKRSLILLISIIFVSEILYAQLPLYRQFTEEDGLPSNTTYQVFEDKKGYLYITTSKGICRFDGAEFIKIPMPDLQSEDIPIAAMDDDGKLWAANLAGELVCVEGLSYKRITLEKYPEKTVIKTLRIERNSLIIDFISNINNLISIEYNLKSHKFIKVVNIYKKFYFDNLVGLVKYKNFYEIYQRNSNKIIKYRFNYKNLENNKIVSFPKIIYYPDSNLYENINQSINEIFDIEFNSKNKIFFINSNKIIESKTENDGTLKNYIIDINDKTYTPIFNEVSINTIFRNKINNLIILTNNDGIIITKSDILSYISYYSNNFDSNLNGIKCISNKYYIGNINKYIFYNYKNEIIVQNIDNSLSNEFLNLFDKEIFLGKNSGLFRLNSNIFISILDFSGVKNLFIVSRNKIFISKNNGVEIIEINKNSFKRTKSISSIRTYALNQRNDTILLGTTKGLYGYYNDSTFAFKGFKKFEIYITKLYVDKNNTIWICTDGKGLIEYKNENDIKYYDLKDGMPSLNCSDIVQIDENKYAVGTDKGLWIYDKKTKFSFMLNKLDGLKSNEITALLNDGENLWVGTTKEIIKCNIKELKPNPEIPFIEIIKKEYEQDGKYYALSDKVNYDQNRVIFEISSRSLLAGKVRKYFYRVIGIDTNWVETSDKRIELLGLKSGEYKFEVKVYNEDGIPCDSPATFSFTILPPWWRTLWFYSVILLISSGGIYWWVQRVKKQEAMKFAVQNQINEYRQQALQSQMNPHFIFNSLNAIQSFLSTNDEKNAMQYLSKFGKLIRLIFEQSKTRQISIEEEIEMLRNYLELEKLRFKGKVEVILNVEEEVLSQDKDILIPPLMIQPIIENSFRHGLFHKGSGGKLEVMFTIEKNKLKCIVRDNGIGRSKSKEINKWREATHKSSGLTTTIDRIILLDNNEGRMSIVINDLKDEEDNPIGTETIILF